MYHQKNYKFLAIRVKYQNMGLSTANNDYFGDDQLVKNDYRFINA